jgi:hypothetical protein
MLLSRWCFLHGQSRFDGYPQLVIAAITMLSINASQILHTGQPDVD